jgi:hypothetical protein
MKIGDMLRYTTTRVDSSGNTVHSGVKSGRIRKVLMDEHGIAYVVDRKGKTEVVLDMQVARP